MRGVANAPIPLPHHCHHPPPPTVAPILLFADESSRLHEQTLQIVAAAGGYSGITAGGLKQQ